MEARVIIFHWGRNIRRYSLQQDGSNEFLWNSAFNKMHWIEEIEQLFEISHDNYAYTPKRWCLMQLTGRLTTYLSLKMFYA